MRVIAIHQPQYLPWLGLLDRVARVDEFVVLDNVPYSKNYFYNRNRVKTCAGATWLTIPILTHGKGNQTFVESHIDNSVRWRVKHWNCIKQSYGKAPFFPQHAEPIEALLAREWDILAEVAVESLRYLLASFEIRTPLVRASELGVIGHKEDLLLDIVGRLGADAYLSGPDGVNYLTLEKWETRGCRVDFQHYEHPQYPQLHGDFFSHLSALDLLFNVGGTAGRAILTGGQPAYFADDTSPGQQ